MGVVICHETILILYTMSFRFSRSLKRLDLSNNRLGKFLLEEDSNADSSLVEEINLADNKIADISQLGNT